MLDCDWSSDVCSSDLVFGGEDFRAAEISQIGLQAGVPENTVYCGLESNIVRYYEALEALL
jgi:hypothetical protein